MYFKIPHPPPYTEGAVPALPQVLATHPTPVQYLMGESLIFPILTFYPSIHPTIIYPLIHAHPWMISNTICRCEGV